MPQFASVDDVEAVAGCIDAGDRDQVERLIGLVSALVAGTAEQDLERVDNDVVEIPAPTDGRRLWLPQWPVRAVHSVAVSDVALAAYSYRWSRVGYIDLVSGACWPCASTSPYPVVTIDYDHGFVTVPPALAALVVSIVARIRANPEGVQSESLGAYSVVHGMIAGPGGGVLDLSESERRSVRRAWTHPMSRGTRSVLVVRA